MLLELLNISKKFAGAVVLDAVSLAVAKGAIATIIGPSGSGKTTLLRCINLLETPEQGRLLINFRHQQPKIEIDFQRPILYQDLLTIRRSTAMVFQQYNLFPHLSVLENLLLGPLKVHKKPLAQAKQEALEILEIVGLADKANSYPVKLSGGQQQRVAIARSLMLQPELLLFDEPTAALDPELSDEVLQTLKLLPQLKNKPTIIIVTHELKFARDISDYTFFMDQGRIIEQGKTAEFFNKPTEARSKLFLAKYFKQDYFTEFVI